MEVRKCCGCGKTHPLTLFGVRGYTTVDGTRKESRRKECNSCRQFKRNGGRPSKPKVGASQTLVKVKGKTYKQCSNCQESKKLEAFNKDKNALTGYSHYCRNCANERKRKIMRQDQKHVSQSGLGMLRIKPKLKNKRK